ncbi:MAG: DEAD/DEAH box helicase [Alphaproteobacteria bacterium]|nr:DEAD/DEAH box helicase [Alphaproteobacteria bacterium]
MILDRYLSQKKLQQTLSPQEFENLEFVLEHFMPSDKKLDRSIYHNDYLLGQIHFSKYMGNYLSKHFRQELYDRSKDLISDIWLKYFASCGKKNISNLSSSKTDEIVKKFVTFDWDDNSETKNFIKFFNYPTYMIPDGKKDLETKMTIYGEQADFIPFKTLLDYQSVIVHKALKELKHENSRRLIQMPTGTGKTRVAMEIIARILNNTPDIQILWFANKSELLGQAHQTFQHVWNHLGKFPVDAIVAWGKDKIPKIPESRVIVFAGYKKMNNFINSNTSLKPDYIVIDEAHQILAKTYKLALEELVNRKFGRVLGLTATPGRGIDETQNKKLAKIFHGKIIEIKLYGDDEINYEKNIIKYLEFEDILAKAILDPMYTKDQYPLSKTELSGLRKLIQGDRPELTDDSLEKLANDNTRNIQIIDKLHKLASDGKKILYFATSKSQSLLVFMALQQLEINAIHVDSDTDHSFRRQIVRKFIETNEIQIICNYDIFSTGFDVPKLDVVFIGRPVMSPVLYNQMVGRGTRGLAMDGKKSFTLIQVIDKFNLTSAKFDPYEHYRYWDETWRNNN